MTRSNTRTRSSLLPAPSFSTFLATIMGGLLCRLTLGLLLLLVVVSAHGNVVFVQGSGNPAFNQKFTELLQSHLGEQVSVRPFGDNARAYPKAPVVTLGPDALTDFLETETSHPVIALLVNQRLVSGFLGSEDSDLALTSLYYDPPLVRQALIGRSLLPQATRVALLARPDDRSRYDTLVDELAMFGLEARVFLVTGEDVLIQTLTRALSFGDFLLATPDDVIYNPRTIKHILLTTYRRNRLVVGPGHAFVKAGVLVSSYAPMTAYVRESAGVVQRYLQSGELPPPAYPIEFDIEINHQVARSLNIPLPDQSKIIEDVRKLLDLSTAERQP